MNEPLPEIPNPLNNGKVIKTDTPIKEYLDSKSGQDGEPRILSRSDLTEIGKCPARWHKGFVEEERRLPNIEFGSLFDCLLLQPKRFEEYYTLAPEEYTNSKGLTVPWTWKSSTCRDWREEQEAQGKLVCTDEDLQQAKDALNALLSHPDLGSQTSRLLIDSVKQVFVIAEYHDQDTGIMVPVKCLTDIVPGEHDPEFGKSLFDLKTCKSAHPRAWKRQVFDCNYHVQAAINLDCHQAAGANRWDFRHLLVENFPPYEPARRFVTQEFLTLGRMKYLGALKIYCQCVKTGVWPSYPPADTVLPDGYEATGPEAWMVGA